VLILLILLIPLIPRAVGSGRRGKRGAGTRDGWRGGRRCSRSGIASTEYRRWAAALGPRASRIARACCRSFFSRARPPARARARDSSV